MTAHAAALLGLLLLSSCARTNVSVIDTFPEGSYASPWVLQDHAWSGSFERAAAAIGVEAAAWNRFEPARVWLAVYRHEDHQDQKVTVRAFAFGSAEQARAAYDHFKPLEPRAIKAGDEGCWTDDGILFVWGRMVFDLFGSSPTSYASPEQCVYLLAFIEREMPPDLPSDPR